MANTADSALNSPRRRSLRSWLIWTVLALCVLLTLYTLFMLSWSYAEGERAGVLQKFSRRGWICKTNEGELAMYVVGGVAPQIWHFSARDKTVADQLHKAVGHQVRLHYAEHPGLPTSCFGETRYFVEHLEVVDSPGVIAPSSGMTIGPGGGSADKPDATPPH